MKHHATPLVARATRWITLAVGVALLTGRASTRLIESEVRSFAGSAPAATPATYRFERLPSQLADNTGQALLEAAAQQVLATKGLTPGDDKARYSVQLRLEVGQISQDPLWRWDAPFARHRWLFHPFGDLWYSSRMMSLERDAYRHTVHVLVRDTTAGIAAFEANAVHDGRWSDTRNLLAPILEAALRDFPQGNGKPQNVTVELPNK